MSLIQRQIVPKDPRKFVYTCIAAYAIIGTVIVVTPYMAANPLHPGACVPVDNGPWRLLLGPRNIARQH